MRRFHSSSNIHGLLVLNGVMLAILAAVTFSPAADAQARARGDYVMASGRAPGTNAGAVYIVDAVNQEMMVLTYNQTQRRLEGVAYANLAHDAQRILRGPQPGR